MKKVIVMDHKKSTKRTEVYEAPNSHIGVLYINRAAFHTGKDTISIPTRITVTIEADEE